MLTRLEIHNYAIIDTLSVSFGPGMNVLTGETGAGKSIIIGAIELLLGKRISTGALRKGTKLGYVEGEFDLSSLSAELQSEIFDVFLRSPQGGAKSNILLVRREFTESGGSKNSINGIPANLSTLKRVFEGLIDMHGQHQHQLLLYPENYYEIIDRFGGIQDAAQKVADSFARLKTLRREKRSLEESQSKLTEMRDYMQFQLKEIKQINPQPDEEDSLEKEWKVLQNAEKIISLAMESYRRLYDDDSSALSQILSAQKALEELTAYDSKTENIVKDLADAAVGVEEAAKFLQRYRDTIESNPVRLEEINLRLMSIRELKKKYKTDIEGILQKKAEIEERLESEENLNDRIKESGIQIEKELTNYGKLCIELSNKRTKSADSLQKKASNRLKFLGMTTSLFEILVIKRDNQRGDDTFSVNYDGCDYYGDEKGIDDIEFRIATGKSERIMPISQIASGGELSRLMLALKAALMEADHVPTLIFDEIDTGISGRIAAAVGKELHNLASVHQILCITHLPQIAAMADRHFNVSKAEQNGRIITRIENLDNEGRKQEIAKLLAGETVTESYLKSAEDLLRKNA